VADERAGLHARYEARAAADARQPTQRAYHPERPGPRGAPALLRERAREGGGGLAKGRAYPRNTVPRTGRVGPNRGPQANATAHFVT
jgi:hypothetical protein